MGYGRHIVGVRDILNKWRDSPLPCGAAFSIKSFFSAVRVQRFDPSGGRTLRNLQIMWGHSKPSDIQRRTSEARWTASASYSWRGAVDVVADASSTGVDDETGAGWTGSDGRTAWGLAIRGAVGARSGVRGVGSGGVNMGLLCMPVSSGSRDDGREVLISGGQFSRVSL